MSFKSQIQFHSDTRQGYTVDKPQLLFAGVNYDYTEDTGTLFKAIYEDREYLVSSACDGHAGYMTSFSVTSVMEKLFNDSIHEKKEMSI